MQYCRWTGSHYLGVLNIKNNSTKHIETLCYSAQQRKSQYEPPGCPVPIKNNRNEAVVGAVEGDQVHNKYTNIKQLK